MKKNKTIGITELVLRDGHQSLIATRMKTEDMLPVCNLLDNAGYHSLEVWGGATFDSCVRFLRENPWERLQQLRQSLPHTPLQMLIRGKNLLGYRPYPTDVINAFVRRSAHNGMDIFRVFDAMNDFDNMQAVIQAVKNEKKHAQGTICYTTSPVHTIKNFIELAHQFADANCDSIAIKDMAGIMTPESCAQLVTSIKKQISLPLHIHSHCTSGLSPLCQLRAVESGADVIDTVISPFSGGASHPATETMHTALSEANYTTHLKTDVLESIAEYFTHTRKKYWQFENKFTGVDPTVLKHHVPGGMISNLVNQLREQDCLDKLPDVLTEIPRVRHDFGYPPLVTPTSQIVAAQATLNVITGNRYSSVTQETKQYLQGNYGKIPGKIDQDLYKKVITDNKNEENAAIEENEMSKLTNAVEGLAKNEDDVLIYAMFPEIGKIFLQERSAGKLQPLVLASEPSEKAGATADDFIGKPSEYKITIHGETYTIRLSGLGSKTSNRRPLYFTVDGISEEALVETSGQFAGIESQQNIAPESRPKATQPGHVTTTIPGTITSILVKDGDRVKAGDAVLVIEAMKMENSIIATVDGEIAGVLVSKGDNVKVGDLLIDIADNKSD